jgi:hypothetical protein
MFSIQYHRTPARNGRAGKKTGSISCENRHTRGVSKKADFSPQTTQFIDIQVSCPGGLPRPNLLVWYYRQYKHTNGESVYSKTCKITLLPTSIQGELQHKMIKRRFTRTNKHRFTSQLAAAEVRERVMRRIAQRLAACGKLSQIKARRIRPRKRAHTENSGDDGEESLDTSTRYVIADSTREGENIVEWAQTNCADVATRVWHFKYRHSY